MGRNRRIHKAGTKTKISRLIKEAGTSLKELNDYWAAFHSMIDGDYKLSPLEAVGMLSSPTKANIMGILVVLGLYKVDEIINELGGINGEIIS